MAKAALTLETAVAMPDTDLVRKESKKALGV
jgi:hypothetical protein